MMSTYAVMQTRIADEIARADLSDQIKLAILSAVDHYKDERFWFNEGEVSFYTVAGTDHTELDVTFGELDIATVTVSGSRNEMLPANYTDIRQSVLQSTLTGQPHRYAIFEESIWYDPIPDDAYLVTLSGLIYFTTLSADDDTNAWTTEAEQLIRHHAKADLFANVTRNDKEAQKMAGLVTTVFLPELRKKTIQKANLGRLRPTRF